MRIEKRRRNHQLGIALMFALASVPACILAGCQLDDTSAAKVALTNAHLKGIETSLRLYKLDGNSFPSSAQGLIALVSPPSGLNPEGYLREVPKDAWGHDFVYVSDGKTFTVLSLGADGAKGGTDAAADIEITSED